MKLKKGVDKVPNLLSFYKDSTKWQKQYPSPMLTSDCPSPLFQAPLGDRVSGILKVILADNGDLIKII